MPLDQELALTSRVARALLEPCERILAILPRVTRGAAGFDLVKLVDIPSVEWVRRGREYEMRRSETLRRDLKHLYKLLKLTRRLSRKTWDAFASACGETGYSYWGKQSDSAHSATVRVAMELFKLLRGEALLAALDSKDWLRGARILEDSVEDTCRFLGAAGMVGLLTTCDLPGDMRFRVEQEAARVRDLTHKLDRLPDGVDSREDDGFVPISTLVNHTDKRCNSINAIKRFMDRHEKVRHRPGRKKDGGEHKQRLMVHRGDFLRELRRDEQAGVRALDSFEEGVTKERNRKIAADERKKNDTDS